MIQGLIDKWDTLDPAKRKKLTVAAAIGLILILAIGVNKLTKKDRVQYEKTATNKTMMLPESQKMDLESMHSEQFRLRNEIATLKTEQVNQDKQWSDRFAKELESAKKGNKLTDPTTDEELNRLKAELENLKGTRQGPVVKGKTGTNVSLDDSLPSPKKDGVPSYKASLDAEHGQKVRDVLDSEEGGPPTPAEDGSGISKPKDSGGTGLRISSGSGDSASADGIVDGNKKEEGGSSKNDVYIPAGAILQGVLLSGIDAPTAAHAQKNPMPILIRIKHEAILPNFVKVNVKECFVIASGYGVMSTERANIRTESISCVIKGGGVLEKSLQGYVVGEDGKAGMRGRLVTKQGSIVAKSFTAGIFGSIADAAKPTAVAALNTDPNGNRAYQSSSLSDIMAAGIGEGIANSANDISKFYLDMAKEMFPVIEIDAGRTVEIILVKGASLKFKKQADTDSRASSKGSK